MAKERRERDKIALGKMQGQRGGGKMMGGCGAPTQASSAPEMEASGGSASCRTYDISGVGPGGESGQPPIVR